MYVAIYKDKGDTEAYVIDDDLIDDWISDGSLNGARVFRVEEEFEVAMREEPVWYLRIKQ